MQCDDDDGGGGEEKRDVVVWGRVCIFVYNRQCKSRYDNWIAFPLFWVNKLILHSPTKFLHAIWKIRNFYLISSFLTISLRNRACVEN